MQPINNTCNRSHSNVRKYGNKANSHVRRPDIANATYDRCDSVMLSAETAVGDFMEGCSLKAYL